MSTPQSNIFRYEDDVQPPNILCKRWIPHPVTDGMVGTVGINETTDSRVSLFLHRRNHEVDRRATYNAKYDGYAISTWILRVLRSLGCYTVYVAVTDTGELLEFHLSQYEDATLFEWREGDPQRCVNQADALRVWPADDVTLTDPHNTKKLRIAEKHLAGTGMNNE